LLVEGLKPNPLSVVQMVDHGYDLTFNSKGCEIIKVCARILVANEIRFPNNVYVLNKIKRKKNSFIGVISLISYQ